MKIIVENGNIRDVEEPTTHLRFVERDGRSVLQQKHVVYQEDKRADGSWVQSSSDYLKWKDVPIEIA